MNDAERKRLLWQAHLARVAEEDAAKAPRKKPAPEERAERKRMYARWWYLRNRDAAIAVSRERRRNLTDEQRAAANKRRRQRRAKMKAEDPARYQELLRRDREAHARMAARKKEAAG